ncbi:MAG: hypothetical protein QM784_30350 [Polyangiaceae bacterium]
MTALKVTQLGEDARAMHLPNWTSSNAEPLAGYRGEHLRRGALLVGPFSHAYLVGRAPGPALTDAWALLYRPLQSNRLRKLTLAVHIS